MPARSEAPQDPRPYIRVATDLPMNPKLAAIEENGPACGWAYVVSFCYCGQSLTDGHFPLKAVLRMADVDKDVAESLVRQELWHLPGHACKRCDQPRPGHAVIHDYLQHQRSADEVRELTNKRREAGRKGAEKRWAAEHEKEAAGHRTLNNPYMASAMANAMANAQNVPWQNDGKSIAEERRGEEIQKSKTSPPDEPAGALFDEPEGSKVNRPTVRQVAPDQEPKWREFWYDAYPIKVGRKDALAAWVKAIKKTDADVIIRGARRYRERVERENVERSKIKHAQGWLNGQRWEDEDITIDTTPAGAEQRCPIHPRQLKNSCGPCASEAKVRDREALPT